MSFCFQSAKSIPYTVDEMYVLLEELESGSAAPSATELPMDALFGPTVETGQGGSKVRLVSRGRSVPQAETPQQQKGAGARIKTAVQSHR